MKRLLNHKYGFTLIELMIVMAIIAILVVLGTVAIQTARRVARDTQRRNIAKTVMVALEQYYIDQKQYPIPGCSTGCGSSLTRLANVDLDLYLDDNLSDPIGGNIKNGYPNSCATAIDKDGDPCWRYNYQMDNGPNSYELQILMETKCPCKPYSPGGSCPSSPTYDMPVFEPQCRETFTASPP